MDCGNVADDDARHLLLQGIRDVERTGARNLSGADCIDAGRHLVDASIPEPAVGVGAVG